MTIRYWLLFSPTADFKVQFNCAKRKKIKKKIKKCFISLSIYCFCVIACTLSNRSFRLRFLLWMININLMYTICREHYKALIDIFSKSIKQERLFIRSCCQFCLVTFNVSFNWIERILNNFILQQSSVWIRGADRVPYKLVHAVLYSRVYQR